MQIFHDVFYGLNGLVDGFWISGMWNERVFEEQECDGDIAGFDVSLDTMPKFDVSVVAIEREATAYTRGSVSTFDQQRFPYRDSRHRCTWQSSGHQPKTP